MFLCEINKMKILLASKSPRRKELLESLGYTFDVISIDCDESFPSDLPVDEIAGYLSEKKSNAFRTLQNGEVLITADTIVALENEILGKPKDADDATEMLRKLSGKTHQVYTGITIKTSENQITETDVADVSFSELSDSEIEYYIKNFKPFDKAGSYGIQEWLGMSKITEIKGSFYTIMGLPTHLIYEILKKINF